MKIYTKTGDKGTTGLVGGTRISKTDIRLEAYGTVDELNAYVGVLVSKVTDEHDQSVLIYIQNLLFDLGVVLATDHQKPMTRKHADAFNDGIAVLEKEIDAITGKLPELNHFILPGGGEAAALSHVCRTVSRRAERRMWDVQAHYPVDEDCMVFMNRLSDFFFIFARKSAIDAGFDEFFWKSYCWS
jgi:cob(I)alamin adenosyltransferase